MVKVCLEQISEFCIEIKEFTLYKATTKVQKKKKEHDDCQLCKIVFCSEKGCIETFIKDFQQQNNHMLQGLHNISKATSSFDKMN